ncbi:MAG: ATP synthase F1 subunit delta [Sphingobacteriaceae bacterium]|nr:ATP synthase F1 subunit delta [Cytophagaceae bacterium]
MSEQTVAFRYAKSLLDLAQERGLTDTVAADMQLFSQTIRENRALDLALRSPVVKHYKKLDILRALFQKRVDAVTFSILEIITLKHREGLLFGIAEEFQRQYDDLKGVQNATVTSVVPLTDAQRKGLSEQVAKATNRTVRLHEKLDPKLIGGFVLRVGDRQVDASIRSQLNSLRVSFLQN